MNLFQLATSGIDLESLPSGRTPAPVEAAPEPSPAFGRKVEVPAEIDSIIQEAAATYGVDPNVVRGVAFAESGFDPDVISGKRRSSAGAVGLMQFMPATAKELDIDPLNVREAIFGGAYYLRKNLDKFNGDYGRAVAAYNWGPNRDAFQRDDWFASIPKETDDYVKRVFAVADSFGVEPEPEKSQKVPLPKSDVAVGAPKTPQPAIPNRTWGEAFGDTTKSLAQGLLDVASLPGVAYSAVTGNYNTDYLNAIKGTQDILQEQKSAEMQARNQALQEKLSTAEGWREKLAVGGIETLKDPTLLADTLLRSAPGMYFGGVAGRVAGAVVGQVGTAAMSQGLSRGAEALLKAGVAVKNAAPVIASGTAVGTSAATQGASVAKETFDELMKLPVQAFSAEDGFAQLVKEHGEDGAKAILASAAANRALAVATATSVASMKLVPGGDAIEKMFLPAALKGTAREAAKAATANVLTKPLTMGMQGSLIAKAAELLVQGGKAGALESLSEGVEESTGAMAKGLELSRAGQRINLSEMMGEAGGQGSAAGLALGKVAGMQEAYASRVPTVESQPTTPQAPAATQPPVVAPAGKSPVAETAPDVARQILQAEQAIAPTGIAAELEALRARNKTSQSTTPQTTEAADAAPATGVPELGAQAADDSRGGAPVANAVRADADGRNAGLPGAPAPSRAELGAGSDGGRVDSNDALTQQAAGPATIPATTGVDRESQASQTQQGSTQQPQAGGPQAGAATATASTIPAGGNRVQAAGLTDGAPAQNPRAQAAPAAGTQVQAEGSATRLGRDNTPLNEGGKPFKTRKAAGDAKKLQPMMRVVKVDGGYALAEKTPAQIAAMEKAAQRLRNANTSPAGEPIPAHSFIAAAGGMQAVTRNDMGVDGNPRVGNRRLFAGAGRGLSIEQATQMLIADGYLAEGASHNDAYALIKKSLTQPQYNADGIERIAEAEAQTQFDDYLAAQEEAALEGGEDLFGMANEFTAEELDEVGYTDADPALQAEVAALIAQAEAIGIDTYAILEDIARTYANATQDQYNAAARDAIAQAIARGNQDGGSTAAQASPAAEPASDQELDQPPALELASQTPAEAAAQQDAAEQAAKAEAAAKRAEDVAAKAEDERKRIAQASVRAADTFELGQDPLDSLTGQGSIFDDAPAQSAPTAASDDEGRERFTLSIEMFGDVPYRASKPVDAGSGKVVSSRVITAKTRLTAANAERLGLPKDKGTVYAWRVSVIRRANGETHAVIEAMATDNGRSPDGEVLAHFKPVDNPDAMDRIAPAIVKAAMADWQAAQSQQAPAATEPVAQPITRADNRNQVKTKKDDTGNVAMFSFAGARAATADTHALVTAQDRLDAGEDPETVRRETGWHRGPDGRMRFEINDADAKLLKEPSNPNAYADIFDEAASRSNGVPLAKVLDHPALFAAYPKLQTVRLIVDDKMDGNGSYSAQENAIRVRDPYGYEGGPDKLLSVLLHEIQHGIQDIEGFATGDSPERLAKTMPDAQAINDAKLLAKFMERGESAFDARQRFMRYMGRDPNPQGVYLAERNEPKEIARMASTPLDAYKRNAGEVEARNTQARQGMTDAERRATAPGQTADVADADVIVVFNGKEMANAPMPANAAPDAAAATHPLRTPATTIRAAITKAYGKLLGQLESKGLVTLTQTQDEAIEAAAQARADKTGQPLAEVRASLMGSVSNSVATDTPAFKRWFGDSKVVENGLEELLSKPDGVGVLLRDLLAAQNATGSGLNPVQALMLALAKNDKIGRGIVGLVPVDVVNSFSKDGLRPKDGGGNTSMFVNALNAPVSDQVLSTFRGILTSLSTKLANAIATGRDQEIAPALLASDFNLREVGGLLSLQGSTDFWGGNTGVKSVSAGEAAKSTSPGLGSPAKDFKLDATALADLFNKFVSFAPHAKTSTSDDLPSAKYIAKQGKPLVVYHGTKADFSRFSLEKFGQTDGGWAGEGIYFAPNPDEASLYATSISSPYGNSTGANVMPVFLSAKNPLEWRIGRDGDRRIQNKRNELGAKEFAKWVQSEGYDSVHITSPDIGNVKGEDQWVVFQPEQIKSAIGNNGNFDPSDPDIRRSADGSIQGFFDPQTGQSFLIADNLTAEAAPGTLMHEVGIHMAADGKLQPLFDRALQLLKLGRSNPFIQRVQSRMDAAGETSGEEAAAYIVTEYENDRAGAPSSVASWVKDFIADVRAWLFSKGVLLKAEQLSVADIAAVARANARSMAQSDGQGGVQVSQRGPGLLYSNAGNNPPPIPTSAQNGLFNTPPWQLPEATHTDKLIYELQDGRVDLKRVQEAIAATGKAITEAFDARLAETLLPGRVARRTETFLTVEAKPLLESMAKNNVSQDELSDYLLARHAPERNAQVAKVNPDMPDGGAGTNSQGVLMTTQAARDHIAALTAGKRTALELLARQVDAITAGTRDILVREGLEKQETIDAWMGAYKHYVPLFKDESMDTMAHPMGSGLSVTGSASRRATGSTGEVTNMLAHVLMQRETAITRAEKNRAAMSLYGLALTNPNAEMWTTIRPSMPADQIADELVRMGVDPMEAEVGMQGVPTIRGVDPVSGKVVDRPNPMYKRLDNALTVKVNGEDRVILFNAENERAMRLVRNLKNQDGVLAHLDLAGSFIGKATRYFASINTQYNPAFGMVNVIRDVGGALVNLSDTALAGKQARVLSDSIPASIGIARDLRGDAQRTPWSDLWQQFQDDGGRTGYRDLFTDPYKRAEAVQSELDKLSKQGTLTPGAAAHAVLDLLDDFNTTLENGVRLSAYKAALDQGLSRAEAARLARELTLDFNRKGRAGRELGPLFAFFNASVQGTARTLKALQGPAGKRILIGGVGLGVMQALMLAAAGFDDDEIPEFVKARALIIPMPGKQYIAIPLQFGLNALPNTGRVATELLMSGGKDWAEKSFNALGELAGSFNPLGGGNIFTGAGLLKTVAPTVVDPIVDMATNTDFTGKPIGKERMPWDTRPGFAMARESTQRAPTGQAYVGISKAINSLSGGNDFARGLASPSPEEVRYVFTTLGGGVYRELEKVLNASLLTAQGETLKAREVPFGSRFAGEVEDADVQRGRYFKNNARLEKLEAQLKGLSKEGRGEELRALVKDNPEIQLYELNNQVSAELAKLNKLAAQSINDREALKRIDEARTQYMRALNDKMRELERAATKAQ